MNTTAPDNELVGTLQAFKVKANAHPRIPSLIKGWEPTIVLESSDSGQRRYMRVQSGQIQAIGDEGDANAHTVHLRATDEVLQSVFDGRSNPAEAFLDGALEIFATDKDQVKLDAISLVLWGA